jgi:hypothetical protein
MQLPLRRTVAAAGALTLVVSACSLGDPSQPLAPWNPVDPVSFAFEGTLEESCVVISLQVCEDAPFGDGIPPGTSITGTLTFDANSQGTVTFDQPGYRIVRYPGVNAELVVGADTLHAADPRSNDITLFSQPDRETMHVSVCSGFAGGRLAGLSVDFALLGLRVTPSRYPVTSLPGDPAVFAAALADSAFEIVLRHHTQLSPCGLGLVASGSYLSGLVTSIDRP